MQPGWNKASKEQCASQIHAKDLLNNWPFVWVQYNIIGIVGFALLRIIG